MASQNKLMKSLDDAVAVFKSETGLELLKERIDFGYLPWSFDGTKFLFEGELYGTLIVTFGGDGLLQSAAYRGKHPNDRFGTLILGLNRLPSKPDSPDIREYGRQDSHKFEFLGRASERTLCGL